MCSEGGLPSEMQDLELAIHHHQTLYEQFTQAYTEVRTNAVLSTLIHLGVCLLVTPELNCSFLLSSYILDIKIQHS